MSFADREEEDETLRGQKYYKNVCDSFRQHAIAVRKNRFNHARRIALLPEKEKSVLPRGLIFGTNEWRDREACFQEAELKNQFFFDSLLKYHNEATSKGFHDHLKLLKDQGIDGDSSLWSTEEDIDKTHSVLKSLARDWSKEMSAEREMCYKPILDAVLKYIPLVTGETGSSNSQQTLTSTSSISRLVVPGAGVSRLALELSSMGYEVQGNEFSYHMLLASDYILNACSSQNPFSIAPWIGSTKNICKSLHPARQMLIPDVDPAEMLARNKSSLVGSITEDSPSFSMGMGEFASTYRKPSEHGAWAGVISCFFLDTAPSIIEYMQVVYDLLSENGVFINFGPLLYHWSGPPARPSDNSFDDYVARFSAMDQRYLTSLDLSWEDARAALLNIGFEIIEEKLNLNATYTVDEKSLMSTNFRCIFFVAKKSTVSNLNCS